MLRTFRKILKFFIMFYDMDLEDNISLDPYHCAWLWDVLHVIEFKTLSNPDSDFISRLIITVEYELIWIGKEAEWFYWWNSEDL